MSPILENFIVGVVSGLTASCLTLFTERLLRRRRFKSQLNKIPGEYQILENSLGKDTSKETVTIELDNLGMFNISASGGASGSWEGHFQVHEDSLSTARGFYSYVDKNDWGEHIYFINRKLKLIQIHGANRSDPGRHTDGFSITIKRKNSKQQTESDNELT